MAIAIYNYRALQADGTIAEGQLEAGGRQEACRIIEDRGMQPISLQEASGKGAKSGGAFSINLKNTKVTRKALESFTRQLSSLLSAGVPLSRALRILSKEAASQAAREKWKTIHDLVIDGASLADAMAKSPETFPRVYTAMVQAGETGGFLDVVLGQIADFQLREKELKSKVVAAMIYPAVLFILASSVLILLLIFFIPTFKDLFQGYGEALPAITQFVVALSEFLLHYGPFAVLGIVTIIFIARNYLRSSHGKRAWEQLLLSLPVFGPLVARFAMTRFCRMFGTLIGAGVPMINSLRVARESLGNQILIDAISESIDRVKKGDRLAASLADCPKLFPATVQEMISIAEESGRLDTELVRLADTTDGDLDRQLKMAVALAEPFILFIMAALIGFIIIAMVLPIFNLHDFIK